VHIRARVLGIPGISLPGFAYGAVTLSGGAFQLTSARPVRECPGPEHSTFPVTFRHGVRFGLYRFRSPLLPASRLLSFPPLTKMFQFRGFPLAAASVRRSAHEVAFGNPGFEGRVRLARAYRSLLRPSSAREPSHPPPGVGRSDPLFGATCGVSSRRSSDSVIVIISSQGVHAFIAPFDLPPPCRARQCAC